MTNKFSKTAAFIVTGLIAGLTTAAIADDDLPPSFQDNTVSIVTASEVALEQVSDSVISAGLENEDRTLIWEVEVMNSEKQTVEVIIDATSGAFLQLEEDD